MDGSHVSRRIKAALLRGAAGSALLGAAMIGVVGGATGGVTSAWATSAPYELYCPGTPVGIIALNNVTTSGTITPANPAVGSTFQITGYQNNVTIPSAIVTAAAALGNASLQGSATAKLDATGATPATLASPPLSFNQTIPSPVPSAGMTLTLPASPSTVGPFTATSSNITVTIDKTTSLGLVVSGSTLTLTCTAYANNTIPNSGIVPAASALSASAPSISPTLASTTATGSATPTTTVAPQTAPLAQTGAGPGVWLLGELGLGTLVLAALLLLGDRGRRAFAIAWRTQRGGRRGQG